MGISIGNGNKIEKSTIAETIENKKFKNDFLISILLFVVF